MRDWAQVERYLRRIADTDGITEEHLWNVRESSRTEGTASVKLTDESVDSWSDVQESRPLTEDAAFGSAVGSWGRFRRGDPLTAEDKSRLEVIVLPNGLRPAFDIKDDSFADLPDPWQGLNAHRPFLSSCIRGVGRLNVPGHATLQYAGTAFVVGADLLLTNRHVAEAFCQTGGAGLAFTPGISPSFDVKQEVGSSTSVTVNVTRPVLILSDWDAALFRIDGMPPGVVPLRLAGAAPANAAGRLATVIGYPAMDTRGSTDEILQQIQIFRAIFDKKRLQPGRLMGFRLTMSFGGNVSALAHDCTTLGGNSGSAVIDVEGEEIVGLHFGGDYLLANYAVPSWALADQPRLHDEGVQFT